MVAYTEFIMSCQVEQALAGQIPPIFPSGAVVLMGSVFGESLNAK